MDLSRYAAATLHQDSEFVWCRGRAPASPTPHRPSVRGWIGVAPFVGARRADPDHQSEEHCRAAGTARPVMQFGLKLEF
jgi:hypothetical protein